MSTTANSQRAPNPPRGFFVGAAYYPELWPETRWETDARLMKALGFNIVRLGEFAWNRLEPKDGQFDFGWLQRAVDLFHKHGVNTCLCTPTAAPPRWVTHQYPDTRWVDHTGQVSPPDARKHVCYANATFRHFTHRITEQLAMTLAGNPAIVAWQIDNEFGAHGSGRCYCPSCEEQFREWLRQSYADIENLNAAWGTAVWGRQYAGWEEISLPRPSMGGQGPCNKAAALDHARFAAATTRAFLTDQAQVVSWFFPSTPVTTNWMAAQECGIDWPGMAADLDFTAWNNYANNHADATFSHDFTRGMKGGLTPHWVLEQKSGPPDTGRANELPPDGEATVRTLHDLACGADGVLYFTWRQMARGPENAHGGILSVAGAATRVLAELQKSLPRIRRVGEAVAGSQVRAPLALVMDMDSWWSLSSNFPQRLKRRTQLFNYLQVFRDLHRASQLLNVDVDIVPPTADFTRYRMLLVPGLAICPLDTATRLKTFVADGGWLLATTPTAAADANGNLEESLPPYGLHELFGACITETDCPPDSNPVAQEFQKVSPVSGIYPAKILCDLLKITTAEVWATYSNRFYKGTPSVTANKFGRGVAIYVGALSSVEMYMMLLLNCCKMLHVPMLPDLPDDIQVRRRYQGQTEFMFVLNHSDHEVVVPIESSYFNLLTGEPVAEAMTIPAYDCLVLKR